MPFKPFKSIECDGLNALTANLRLFVFYGYLLWEIGRSIIGLFAFLEVKDRIKLKLLFIIK